MPPLRSTAFLLAAAFLASCCREQEPLRVSDDTIEYLLGRITESGIARQPVDYGSPLLQQRIILVTEEINEVIGSEICRQLLYLDRSGHGEPITLFLKTHGGWQADAFAIIDTMLSLRSTVDVIALGDCKSAGTMILAAGTGRRLAAPNALLMLHDVEQPGDTPNSFEFESRRRFEAFLHRHTRMPGSVYPTGNRGEREIYVLPEEAIAWGIIDGVFNPPKAMAPPPPASRP